MNKHLSNILFIIYFFSLYYLLLKSEYISNMLGLPTYVIPILTFLVFVFISKNYVKLNLNKHKSEYEFTSIVNHIFRTPITSILWSTKEIEKDITINERLSYLQNITTSANKVLDILDIFAGIQDIRSTVGYKFEATSVRDMVEKAMVKYKEEISKKNITFQVSTFKDVPLITLDTKKIGFVIESVIENAIIYSQTGGKVLIDCISDKGKLSIYVADSGIGLDTKDKYKIFSKFYRGKRAASLYPDGTGLRLYLAKIILKRHSGKIYAKSNGVDKGTTIIIELPYHN